MKPIEALRHYVCAAIASIASWLECPRDGLVGTAEEQLEWVREYLQELPWRAAEDQDARIATLEADNERLWSALNRERARLVHLAARGVLTDAEAGRLAEFQQLAELHVDAVAPPDESRLEATKEVEQMHREPRDKPLRLKFGDVLINIAAGPTNPHRIGVYIETTMRRGGIYLRLRAPDGEFCEYDVRCPYLVTPEEAHDRIFEYEAGLTAQKEDE